MDDDLDQTSFEHWRRFHCAFLPCTLCEHRRGAGDATENGFCSKYEHGYKDKKKTMQTGAQGD